VRITSPSGILKQGRHPDPFDSNQPRPNYADWSIRQRRAHFGPEMELYRASLQIGGADTRTSVLDDLGHYFGLPPEVCVDRCVNWEEWSTREWQTAHLASTDGRSEFYQTVQSWAFDLLWYAYLQAEGYMYPVSVAIAQALDDRSVGGNHLDFGSGVGVTSQLFTRLGYTSELADISSTLLAFAAFRLRRRSESANFIDLNKCGLETGRYDVITAVDTLVHVPNIRSTARMLHEALKPEGLLFANFDVRPTTPENAWHLYDDDLPLRWTLQRVGFEPEETYDGMITRYRRVNPIGATHAIRGARDTILLRSPLRPAYRFVRRSIGTIHARGV
jgi:SAM-dependent methyltransferase